jgi:hypothetical protein
MIVDIFPTKVLIKDYNKNDDWNLELQSTIKSIFFNELSKGIDYREIGDNSIPLFTEENLKTFPILTELKEMFVNDFLQLAESFPDYEKYKDLFKLSREGIEHRLSKETGRLPFMLENDRKDLHDHTGSMAFGVFYTESVDNEKDGGQLVLRDPSFNSNKGFSVSNRYPIETKKNRMIIGPSHVWHEVTPYKGKERTSIVLNLNWD